MEIKIGVSVELTSNALYVPENVFYQYSNAGITHIFDWQADCLKLSGVLDGTRNLVYSAPTSAGKTLVAELIVLKRVLELSNKAFIILPYVSVSREKMTYLQKLFTGLGVRVGGFMAGQSPPGGLAAINVAVCTIEKANSLINRLIEEGRLDEIGVVVIDELHLIGDSHRGYLLELLLTKLLIHSRRILGQMKKNECVNLDDMFSSSHGDKNKGGVIQIVGMSATLPNLHLLGNWLDAEVYVTTFRPVPLTEFVLTCGPKTNARQVYEVVSGINANCPSQDPYNESLELVDNSKLDLDVATPYLNEASDEDGIFTLCLDTLLHGNGVLVFCPTKQWCEQLADSMARHIFHLTQSYFAAQEHGADKFDGGGFDIGMKLATQLDRQGLLACVEQLKRCPAGLESGLARCLGYAVAFHHAGLTVEEREVVELGFRRGVIRILVATSTLSSGVNLPARRVIIRTPLFHGQILDYLSYKQMAGRAGRKGVDVLGQSILLCKPRDLVRVRQFFSSGMKPVNSCLMSKSGGGSTESSLKRALLEVIANGFVETVSDALLYLSSTLLASSATDHSPYLLKNSSSRRRSLRLSQTSKCHSSSWSTPVRDGDDCQVDFKAKLAGVLQTCLTELANQQLICIDGCDRQSVVDCSTAFDSARIEPTALGRAVLSSSLGPVHGLAVFDELDRARRAVALDTELHLVYLLTPIYLDVGADFDWLSYLEQYQSLSPADRRVADLIGIEEHFVTRCAAGSTGRTCRSGASTATTTTSSQRLTLHRRFYSALMLYRLVREDGLLAVSRCFGVNRGLLQSLQQQAATYAGMVAIFCNRLGWIHMERLITNFQSRLCYGVAEELVDLMRLSPLINAERARTLYSAGYNSIAMLASAKAKEVGRLLQRAVPFKKSKSDESNFACNPTRTILLEDGSWVGEVEAAELIVQRAKQMLELDLRVVYGTDLVQFPISTDRTSLCYPSADGEPQTIDRSPNVAHNNCHVERSSSVNSSAKRLKLFDLGHMSSETKSDYLSIQIDGNDGSKNVLHQSDEPFVLTSQLAAVSNDVAIDGHVGDECEPKQQDEVASERLSLDSLAFSCDLNDTLTFSMLDDAFVHTSCESNRLRHVSPVLNASKGQTLDRSKIDYADLLNDSQLIRALTSSQLTFTEIDNKRLANDCTKSLPLTNQYQRLAALADQRTTKKFVTRMDGIETESAESSRSLSVFIPDSQDLNACSEWHNEDLINDNIDSFNKSELQHSFDDFSKTDNQLDSSSLFSIVDVMKSRVLWKTFLNEMHQKIDECHADYLNIQPGWILAGVDYSSTWSDDTSIQSIHNLLWYSGPAGRVATGGELIQTTSGRTCFQLAGMAISSKMLKPNTVFWINFLSPDLDQKNVSEPHQCFKEIQDLLLHISRSKMSLVVWDVKWWYRLVYDLFLLPQHVQFLIHSPTLLAWLANPDKGRCSLVDALPISNLNHVISQLQMSGFVIEPLCQLTDWTKLCSHQSNNICPPSNEITLSTLPHNVNVTTMQSFLLSHHLTLLEANLHLTELYTTIEHPCHRLMANIESFGFGVDLDVLNKCYQVLVSSCKKLENVAHSLAGSPFSLDSPKEISNVLFKRLGLPQLCTDNDQPVSLKRARSQISLLNGRSRVPNSHLPKATNVLLHRLTALHPLPNVLLEWRHLHGILEKHLHSFVRTCCLAKDDHKSHPKIDRISCTYDMYTATGRIISVAPNIQAVPNDIIINWPKLITKPKSDSTGLRAKLSNAYSSWPNPFDIILKELPAEMEIVCPRSAFIAQPGGLLISADFCQLELRLLAHFSEDSELLKLLNVNQSGQSHTLADDTNLEKNEIDPFRKLAAHWLKIAHPTEVSDSQRQQAKQLCYAIIYGMGYQTLAVQLDIGEMEARKMIDSFLRAYPGVQRFISTTIASAHRDGQVQTLNGHVRVLPALSDNTNIESHFRSAQKQYKNTRYQFAVAKAERQAVNSRIQGSAAEIAKMAMLAIDDYIRCKRFGLEMDIHLVLHEHDELIYEVYPEHMGPIVGRIIRECMTRVGDQCRVNVPLPVKLKAGLNWAHLTVVNW